MVIVVRNATAQPSHTGVDEHLIELNSCTRYFRGNVNHGLRLNGGCVRRQFRRYVRLDSVRRGNDRAMLMDILIRSDSRL